MFFSCSADSLPATDDTPSETPDALDAYHDKTRECPYPKADNELYLNPPPFIVPQAMKTGERLQFSLSRSRDFNTPETLTSNAAPWCMYNPHQALETGTWYWRFRNLTANGTAEAWSEPYPFEVKDETPRFVTPAFETFRQNAPRNYPRLYCFLDDRIDRARQRVASHPEYKNLRARAALALQADLNAIGNPYDRITEIKSYMQYLYQAFYLTQQQIYADRLHQLLQLLLATPVTDSQLFASNFTSTDIALCFIEAYDLLHRTLTPAEKSAAEELLMRVLRYYYPRQRGSEENHIFDNHFWQQNLRVLFQATFLLYDQSAYREEVLPMMEYYYELWTARAPASGFNRDGVWHNGSGYFNANIYTLYYMPMLFSHIARKDFLQHPWYQSAGQALVYTWPPQSKSSGFGDGSEKGDTPGRQRVAFADFLARETGDAYAGWYATQCQSTLTTDIDMRLYRMASDRAYATELPESSPKFVWYKDAGEVAMHSDLADAENDLALSFRSSTFGSGSHTTASQNAFNLLYRGVDVYRSAGYYLNFSDAHNLTSYRHTRAHNTILVNGIGQPYSTRGYGNVLRAMGGDNITYCLGDASRAYSGISDDPMWVEAFAAAGITQTPENGFGATPLTRYRRHVLMLHPDIVLIYDELEAGEPVRWDWLLHSPTKFDIDNSLLKVNSGNVKVNSGGVKLTFTATAQLFSNDAMELSQTDRFVVSPTPEPNPSYPNQWHFTACINGKTRTRILAIIQVKPGSDSPEKIERNGNILTCGNWTIEAELDAALPARLSVGHQMKKCVFGYGEENLLLNGESYSRMYRGSSVLYDKANGEYNVIEQKDYLPASTRAG